jgi:hypothetical protein
LEIVDGQPPQVAPPQHQNPDAPSWHRELVLGAVDTAAADEAAPTFDNTEGQGDRCRLSGVAPGAAMKTAAQSYAARQLELLARRGLEVADRVACGQLGFIDGVDMLYSAAIWAGLRETVGDDLIRTLAAAFAGARRPT